MAKSIAILQVGDLHFDRLETSQTISDVHDGSPPQGLVSTLNTPLMPLLADALSSVIDRHEHCAIVFCGDLTSRGDLDVFARSLDFIAGVVGLDSRAHVSVENVHVVPGNHDVDYRGSMPFTDLGVDRFAVLEDAVANSNLEVPITTEARTSQVADGSSSSSISLTSINTARGQGSPRRMDMLKDELHEKLCELAAEQGVDITGLVEALGNSVDEPHEILDIPIAHPDDLNVVQASLGQNEGLIVVAGHHGFLPQGVSRLNPYTEMVNGGAVRELLLMARKPVLYLHGHIHRGSIEILDGGPDEVGAALGGPVVVVSAPLLEDGFNEIVVEFSDLAEPLGLSITRHRTNKATGVVQSEPAIPVPLAVGGVLSPPIGEVLSYLSEHRACRGQDLVEMIEAAGGSADDIAKMTAVTEQAVWQGVLTTTPLSVGKPFSERSFLLGA